MFVSVGTALLRDTLDIDIDEGRKETAEGVERPPDRSCSRDGNPCYSVYRRLLRGNMITRTYGIHKPIYTTIFGPIDYGPPS